MNVTFILFFLFLLLLHYGFIFHTNRVCAIKSSTGSKTWILAQIFELAMHFNHSFAWKKKKKKRKLNTYMQDNTFQITQFIYK